MNEQEQDGIMVDETDFRDMTEAEIQELQVVLDKVFGPANGSPRPYILIVKTAKSIEGISNTTLKNQARLASRILEIAVEEKLAPLLDMIQASVSRKN